MKIAISLNDVLRSYTTQLAYVYKKYHMYSATEKEKEEVDIEKNPITDFDTIYDYFGFEDKRDYFSFIYDEAALEVLGHADEMEKNLMPTFNKFLIDIDDEEEHTVELVSRDVYKGVSATYFFLTKTTCNCGLVRLVKDYDTIWDGVDVLVSANPEELNAKPEGKISVKVTNSYNKDVPADFEIKSITQFLVDETFREEVLSKIA